jgi:hypothetical protein
MRVNRGNSTDLSTSLKAKFQRFAWSLGDAERTQLAGATAGVATGAVAGKIEQFAADLSDEELDELQAAIQSAAAPRGEAEGVQGYMTLAEFFGVGTPLAPVILESILQYKASQIRASEPDGSTRNVQHSPDSMR